MPILASQNGNLASCVLVRETPKAWYIDYRDRWYPGVKRISKDGDRQLFSNVDDALHWMGITRYDD